jgi:hypothetical protein
MVFSVFVNLLGPASYTEKIGDDVRFEPQGPPDRWLLSFPAGL